MKGIVVKLKPYTAKLQVSVMMSCIQLRVVLTHGSSLQPDVVTAMQDDLVAQLTTVSAMASVAGSAFGSSGRSLTLCNFLVFFHHYCSLFQATNFDRSY